MKAAKTKVPKAMQVQLSRLFGGQSRIATADTRSDAEWRRDLRLVLAELWNYLDTNVETDGVHRMMITTGFWAADVGLAGEEFFWPSYVEGITRVLLCLIGDYPDHRKRKTGSKKKEHYKLDRDRALTYVQRTDQKIHTLIWSAPGVLELKSNPSAAIHDFRDEVGFDVPFSRFLDWFKEKYPDDYLKIF